ncbi:PH domain-containing protein [Nocardia halotolerans]|uniref:PH domain-containing protein n=1 Tax=Nocardia halotolerans TaxID=1755878 RepID=A0ABV8VHD1_9NOCA
MTTAPVDWQRLDPRMLLVYPVTELVKYIPLLLGSVVIGTTSGNPLWSLGPILVVAGFGVARWFTTTYRIDTDQVALRTGIVQRRTLSVPRSRIRSVDVEADLLHRMLGLAMLEIGTGKQAGNGEGFKLDGLETSRIPALRAELLAHTGRHGSDVTGSADATGSADGVQHRDDAESGVEIGHWRAAWVRYAPLSLTGLAVVAPIAGLGAQYGLIDVASVPVQHLGEDTVPIAVFVIVGLTITALMLVSLAACAQYLATWFGLRVIDNGSTLHLRHGLFTTRQITLDLARFRGATLNEPLLLRAARSAQLEMIMTGENPRQKILPQAPRTAVERTLDELLRPRRRPGPEPSAGTSPHPATEPPADARARPTTEPPAGTWARHTTEPPADTWAAPTTEPTADTWAAPTTEPTADKSRAAGPPSTDSWVRPTAEPPVGTSAVPNTDANVDTQETGGIDSAMNAGSAGPKPTLGAAHLTKSPGSPQVTGAALGTIELRRHGAAARRRRYTKAAWPVGILVAALVVLGVVAGPLPVWIWTVPVVFAVIMAVLAEDRYRGLGHRVLPGSTGPTWLITRRGSLDRNRDCLEAPGIIGWTIRRTFWQRRAGLSTVVAATAAGKSAYLVVDIPADEAVALIEAVTPGVQGSR